MFKMNFRQAIRTVIAAVVVIALGLVVQVSSALANGSIQTLEPSIQKPNSAVQIVQIAAKDDPVTQCPYDIPTILNDNESCSIAVSGSVNLLDVIYKREDADGVAKIEVSDTDSVECSSSPCYLTIPQGDMGSYKKSLSGVSKKTTGTVKNVGQGVTVSGVSVKLASGNQS